MKYDPAKTYYCCAMSTISTPEFVCKDDNENPILFATEDLVWKEIADWMIVGLQQFIDGQREREDTDFEAQDFAVEVVIEDGIIRGKNEYVDPHTINGSVEDLTIEYETPKLNS